MAPQPASIDSLPNEMLRQIFRESLLIEVCYEEGESEHTAPKAVMREAARTASLALRGQGHTDFLKTPFMFDSWQKKDHISSRRKRTAILCTKPLAVSPNWCEVGKDMLLHDNGFVEISTNDADFGHMARAFGLQVWTLSSHSSRPESIMQIEIRPNDDDKCIKEISPSLQYTHLVSVEDIDQLGRFFMCQKMGSTHPETNAIEYQGRCFRIHINHNFISKRRDPFEALIFSSFAAGLTDSISVITVSPNCRSSTNANSQLLNYQMSSTVCEMKRNHDVLGPAYLLKKLSDQYDVVKRDITHHRAEAVLVRILEFTNSMLGCKIDKKDLGMPSTDSRHRALRYLTEMARIAAYRLARIMIQLVIKPGCSATLQTEYVWKAIRLFQYAMLFPTADSAIRNRWKSLCCFQLMRVYGVAGATQLTWGSNKRSMDFFARALDYADPVWIDGILRQKVLVIQDAQVLRKECLHATVNGDARWRTSPLFREAFFHALAKTINVPLLATCWSDDDEAVFPDMTDFFQD